MDAPHTSASRGATVDAVAPGPWLAVLRAAAAAVRATRRRDDTAVVHDLRVAARRLGLLLWCGDRRALVADLRRLRQLAGAVRDLDVAAARHPLLARLAGAARRGAARELRRFLGSPRAHGLLLALPLLPGVAPAAVRAHRAELAARTRIRLEVAVARPSPPTLHRLRRELRRLRYASEWLDERRADLVHAQDLLGEAGDGMVCLALARELGAAPLLVRELDAALARTVRRAVAALPAIRRTLEALR